MRKIFIGDVHSCVNELRHLIDKLQPTNEDLIVFLGDLIDKGDKPIETMEYIKTLINNNNVLVVMGNHDKKLLKKIISKRETPFPVSQDAEQIIRNAKLFYRFPELGIFACHAGIYPNMHKQLGGYIDDDDAIYPAKNKHRGEFAEKLAHTRMVSKTGRMITLGEEKEEDVHWTHVYDGTEGFVFYGHDAWPEVVMTEYTCGIDTGCVYGWYLTAAIVTHEQEIKKSWKVKDNLTFQHVKSNKVYKNRQLETHL